MPILPDGSPAARIYSEICARLPRLPLTHDPAGALEETLTQLEMSDEELLGGPIRDQIMARAVRSGILLRADLNDASHTVSQSLETTEGSYWHGLMHRREPDFSNAKYWFRRVGEHPIFVDLRSAAIRLAEQKLPEGELRSLLTAEAWDPYMFVDACQEALYEGRDRELCLQIADAEWRLLFDFCYRQAVG